jgi:hypothetical protein
MYISNTHTEVMNSDRDNFKVALIKGMIDIMISMSNENKREHVVSYIQRVALPKFEEISEELACEYFDVYSGTHSRINIDKDLLIEMITEKLGLE